MRVTAGSLLDVDVEPLPGVRVGRIAAPGPKRTLRSCSQSLQLGGQQYSSIIGLGQCIESGAVVNVTGSIYPLQNQSVSYNSSNQFLKRFP